MISSPESRMKSCGQKVAPKMWNLLLPRSHSTAWRPFQFSQAVPKNSTNRAPAKPMRRLRYNPVKLRVWMPLSMRCGGWLGGEVAISAKRILSFMARCSSGLDQA
ncbi:hypothetical protein D9M71_826960 [compost metagenome]